MFIFNAVFRPGLLLCLLFPFGLAGRDSTAVSQVSLSYNGRQVTLTIEYKIKDEGMVKEKPKPAQRRDTTGNVFEQFFGSKNREIPPAQASNPENIGSSTKHIENAIKRQIAGNADLELEPDYPEYIIEMAALHKSRKKRERALRIYAANNTERLIQTSQSTSVTYSEGRLSSTATVTITCRLKLKKKTQLVIPEFVFTQEGKKYYSKPLLIDL